jgi:hypothetical protein
MSFLPEIRSFAIEALTMMRNDPEHNVPPILRYGIYQKMNETGTTNPPGLNVMRAKLGLLTAEYVLPIWQRINPIWSYSEEEILTWNLSLEELEQFRNLPDDNVLPERLIGLLKALLEGTSSVDVAIQRIHDEDIWNVVGTIVLEFFHVRDDLPLVACHACQAAHRALYESLGYESFIRPYDLQNFTDDNLPNSYRDAASHAVIAYAAGTRKELVNFNKRQEFWEWWLTEAVPTACSN